MWVFGLNIAIDLIEYLKKNLDFSKTDTSF